jgi:hypothetical protein
VDLWFVEERNIDRLLWKQRNADIAMLGILNCIFRAINVRQEAGIALWDLGKDAEVTRIDVDALQGEPGEYTDTAAKFIQMVRGQRGEVPMPDGGIWIRRALGLNLFEGFCLKYANLGAQDLGAGSFAGCDFEGANLIGCHLEFTNLAGARLCNVWVEGPELYRAMLRGAVVSRGSIVGDMSEFITKMGDIGSYLEEKGAILVGEWPE